MLSDSHLITDRAQKEVLHAEGKRDKPAPPKHSLKIMLRATELSFTLARTPTVLFKAFPSRCAGFPKRGGGDAAEEVG